MHWLPTALSTILFLGSLWCFWKAEAFSRDAFRAAHKLEGARALLRAHEGTLDNQASQLNRLRGMVYALKREAEDREQLATIERLLPEEPENFLRPLPDLVDAAQCDNWKIAQFEGPSSAAAQCECAFCEGKRAEKERMRKIYRPKPATIPTGKPS